MKGVKRAGKKTKRLSVKPLSAKQAGGVKGGDGTTQAKISIKFQPEYTRSPSQSKLTD
jgi:hypothetical protein